MSTPAVIPAELTGLDHEDILDRVGIPRDRVETVFTAGSIVQGWGNVDSDIDLYLICPEPTASPFFTDLHMTQLSEPGILVGGVTAVGRDCDIEVWTTAQVEEVLSKLTLAEQARTTSLLEGFSYFELDFLEKLSHGLPLAGADRFHLFQEALRTSAWQNIQVCQALALADIYITDALGQLESGDDRSAVLSTKLAFGHAVDASSYAEGVFGRSPKWRARRVAEAASDVLPTERYWAVESMSDYDDADRGTWVRRTVALCREIAAATPVVGV